MSSRAVRLSPRVLVEEGLTVPVLRARHLLTPALAAALAAIAFAAKGGLALGRVTDVEIAVTLAGTAVAALAVVVAPVPRRNWGGYSVAGLALLAGLTGLSIVWSVEPTESWVDTNRLLSYLAAFAGAVALARILPWRWESVINAVVLACVGVCGYALLTKVFPGALDADQVYGRLREPFSYWNSVGVMGALAVPALLWRGARREASARSRALAYPALGIVLVAVLMAFSRGSLLAIATGCAFWFAVVPLRLRGAAVLAAAGAGASAVTMWVFAQGPLVHDKVPLSQRADAGHELGLVLVLLCALLLAAGLGVERAAERRPLTERERLQVGRGLVGAVGAAPLVVLVVLAFSSGGVGGQVSHGWHRLTDVNARVGNGPGRLTAAGSVRARYWNEAVKVFDHRAVIGAGAGAYVTARTRFRRDQLDVRHAHGYLVQTASDLGLVGLAVSLALLAAWLAAAARRTGLRPVDRGLAFTPYRMGLLTLTAVVVVFGVHSLVDWTWFVPGNAILALVCAGFVAGGAPFRDVALSGHAGALAPLQPTLRTRGLTAAGMLAVALLAAWAIWQPLRSANAGEDALSALGRDHIDSAYVNTVAARHRNPLAVDPLFKLAVIEQSVGRTKAARKALEEAVRLQPANPETWHQLGNFELYTARKPAPAIAELRAAVYLDPHNQQIQNDFVAAQRLLAQAQGQQGAAGQPVRPPAAFPNLPSSAAGTLQKTAPPASKPALTIRSGSPRR